MKRNLIYHTHVNTAHLSGADQNTVLVQRFGTHETRLEAIARDGLTLSVDRDNLDQMLPNQNSCAPKQAVDLEVCFQLQSIEIKAKAGLFALRRLSRDRFELKLVFTDLAAEDEAHIDSFVEQALYCEPTKRVA